MAELVEKAKALFPPLGPVGVVVRPGRRKGPENRIVCIMNTGQLLTVPEVVLRHHRGEWLLDGELIECAGRPGRLYGTEYFGVVKLQDRERSVPVGWLRWPNERWAAA